LRLPGYITNSKEKCIYYDRLAKFLAIIGSLESRVLSERLPALKKRFKHYKEWLQPKAESPAIVNEDVGPSEEILEEEPVEIINNQYVCILISKLTPYRLIYSTFLTISKASA
jgi:hypothetical protein